MSDARSAGPRKSSAEFFEATYQQAADPWNFATSAYEQGRYDGTMAALRGECFRRAYEPGCSVGVLTLRLAALCVRVDAVDLSQTAVDRARLRCAGLPQIEIHRGGFTPLPDLGIYDLVVLSEIGYYFGAQEFEAVAKELAAGLQPRATLLAVHWTGSSPDHQISGDKVHEILRGQAPLELVLAERHEGFRLDKWVRR